VLTRKYCLHFPGILEQENMTSSLARECTTAQVAGLLSTNPLQNSILVAAGQLSLRAFLEP